MKLSRKLFVTKVDEIGANVLELPYENEQLAMIVVLPNPDSDVRDVQAKLHNFDVSKINDKLELVSGKKKGSSIYFINSLKKTNIFCK